MAAMRIGCSGWNYRHWRGPVYPADLPMREWFAHYAQLFDTVEINNTFYNLPESSTFASWRDRAPAGFVYAIKASRFITHLKRLREPEEPMVRLFGRACQLQDHLGPVLYQLPANFHRDLTRLDDFLAVLPRTLGELGGTPATHALRHVVEFRHPSWYVDDTHALMRAHGAAICLHDKFGSALLEPMDSPFVYVRFHGPTGRYFGRYERRRMQEWAARLTAAQRNGRDIFAYFNNDPEGSAVTNAQELRAFAIAMREEERSGQRMR